MLCADCPLPPSFPLATCTGTSWNQPNGSVNLSPCHCKHDLERVCWCTGPGGRGPVRKQTPGYWSRWSFLELILTASCLAQCFCVFSNLLELCSVPLVGQQGPECWLASETETSSHGDEISTSVTFSPSSSPSPESRTPPRDHLLRAAGGVPLRYSKSDQIINVDWLPLLIE